MISEHFLVAVADSRSSCSMRGLTSFSSVCENCSLDSAFFFVLSSSIVHVSDVSPDSTLDTYQCMLP